VVVTLGAAHVLLHLAAGSRTRTYAPGRGRPVAQGIESTAGIILSAAAVMVITFAMFATDVEQSLKQLGVGLASAILIDATIVRAALLPATMKLLGNLKVVPAQATGVAAVVRARAGR
jgi:uncharacterized membrane protein YdfJ with MMPL/SSD domain